MRPARDAHVTGGKGLVRCGWLRGSLSPVGARKRSAAG